MIKTGVNLTEVYAPNNNFRFDLESGIPTGAYYYAPSILGSPLGVRSFPSNFNKQSFQVPLWTIVPNIQAPVLETNYYQHSSDVSVDETGAESLSSSNSSDEDESFAASVLRAMESGSISPSPFTKIPSFKNHQIYGSSNGNTSASTAVTAINSNNRSSFRNSYSSSNGFSKNIQKNSTSRKDTSEQAFSVVKSTRLRTSSLEDPPMSLTATKSKSDSAMPSSSVNISRASSSANQNYGSANNSSPISGRKMRRTPRARLENHQCPNCHTLESPLWRNCLIKGKILHLCNSCGLRYKKHKYCPHCYKVYYDAETNVHEWSQCISCHNWTHRKCLVEANIPQTTSYRCIHCMGLSQDSE